MERGNGIVIGVVIDLDDADDLGRVRVRYPHLDDQPSDWARIAAPMAGKGRGCFFRPEKDDEVLIAFEHGDPRRPYVLGALWSKADLPPGDDGRRVQNNWRFIRSRSGHMVKLDDTSGSERVEIVGKGGRHQIVIDVSGDKISLSCSSGDLALSAPAGKVSIDASQVAIKAAASMSIEAGGALTVKGATVAIN